MVKLFGREFGKKDEFPEIGTSGFGGAGLGVPGPAADKFATTKPQDPSLGLPSMPSMPSTPSISTEQLETISKNIELVSSKIDALKSSIDYLNQRLANMEASIRQSSQPAQTQQPYPSFSAAQQQPAQEDQGWHY